MKCITCGREFDAERSSAKYCSGRCRTWNFRNPGEPLPPESYLIPKGVTQTIEIVTSEIAREWLESNTRNRRITQVRVERYRTDMREDLDHQAGIARIGAL